MIGQNLYYLNNTKYISNVTNLETVIGELNSYYHTKTPRNIVIVQPSSGARLTEGQYTELARLQRTDAPDLITFMEWDAVNTISYIQNSDKRILLFATEEDMLTVYVKYTAGLLKACGWYDSADDTDGWAADFIEATLAMDVMFTYMQASETLGDISDFCDNILNRSADSDGGAYVVTYQNGKNFSYDLLFWLNDNHRNASVQALIKEKFTVHQSVMAQDVMEHFTSRRHYMAYILSVIDWMNANTARNAAYATNKRDWVTDCYITKANAGNYTAAFYKLEELWNLVKDDTAFIAAHQDKADSDADGWEYMDLYTEFKNVFPIVRKVLQNDFDMDNLTADLKLINTDVQFFSKRQNRIPYLIHKYPL